MYGLLMLLPQSSAFATLRNRLSAVNSLGFLQLIPKTSFSTTTPSSRPGIRRDDIKWNELANHFKGLQMKHERFRRNLITGMEGISGSGSGGVIFGSRSVSGTTATTSLRTQSRLGKK